MNPSMGIELELGVLLIVVIVGSATFAIFEAETARWRKILKWLLVSGLTLGLYRAAGHWALALPIGGAVAGTGFHLWWCRKHGIHPLYATPRRRYYALRGWAWPDQGG